MDQDTPRADEIYLAAVEQPTDQERSAYLDQVCAGDEELRQRVERLLRAQSKMGSFLESPAPEFVPTVIPPQAAESPGTLIGPYKLLEQIGEGGFGIVYMADQQSPVRRRVALKIIKPGMDTKQVLARFKAELQALSLMDHPNIARALDAGATDSGRPYFVMELVRGVPITEYCDQNNLAVHERLDLFVTVCHAVQHAHQKGIIHRDIKPSNVLVTMHDGRAVPKVIDFGVAKAINQQLTQETIFTRFAEMIGTPLYMSPEQAEMTSLDIDTRSDIYSLGVLLYELLTGSTPFDKERLKQAAFDEIRRIIREDEPDKPSTRISSLGATSAAVAAHRHSSPNLLGRLMRGDLDWIVMKALEKDRTRRYETANGLAMDLQRHLADEPVLAGPPSAAYRFHKFARRNRAALAMAAVVTVALLLGIVGTTWQAVRATSERDSAVTARAAEAEQREQAEANLQKARQAVDEYFTLVSESKLLDVPGLQPLRKELLEAALRFYEKSAVERTDDPSVLADLAVTQLRVAEVYLTLGRTDDSLVSIVQALDVIDRLRRDYPAATEQRRRLAGYWKGSRPAQKAGPSAPSDGLAALKTLERLVDTWQKLADENPTEIGFQSDLAAIYAHLGELLDFDRPGQAVIFSEKAEHILETLIRQHPQVPEYRADLARVFEHLVGTFLRLGRSADSYSAFRRSLELGEQLAADFPNVPQYRVDLTINLLSLARRSDTEQPVAVFRRAIDLVKGLVTEFPAVPLYRSLLTAIANGLLDLVRQPGEHQQEAERLYRELMVQVTQLAAENPEQTGQHWQRATASNYMELGKLLEKGGQPQEAEKTYRQGIAILEKLAADHPDDRSSQQMLVQNYESVVSALSAAGRPQEAEKAKLHLLELLQKLATDFPKNLDYQLQLANRHNDFATMLKAAGRMAEAEQGYRRALALKAKLVADEPANPDYRFHLAHSYMGLAYLLNETKRPEEAEKNYRQAVSLFETAATDAPSKDYYRSDLGHTLWQLGDFLSTAKRPAEAETDLRKALAVFEKLAVDFPDNRFWMVEQGFSHWKIGDLLKDLGRLHDAEESFRQAVVVYARLTADFPDDRDYRTRLTQSDAHVIDVLLAQDKQAEAEEAIRQAVKRFDELATARPTVPDYWKFRADSQYRLAQLQASNKRVEEAVKSFGQAVESYEKLIAEFPDVPEYPSKLTETYLSLSSLLTGAGRHDEAEKTLRRALSVAEKLVANAPENADYQLQLAHRHHEIAAMLRASGRPAEAEQGYRRALALKEKLVAVAPANPYYRWHLAISLEALAGLLSETGRKADAEAAYRDALPLWEKLVAEFPSNADYRWHLAVNRDALGNLLKDSGRLDDAAEAYRHALPLWEKLSADSHSDDHRTHLSWTRGWLVEVLLPQGKHAEAAKLAVERARATPDKSESLRAAVYLEQCAAVAQQDASLTPADLKVASDAYAKQAAELMSEAGKRVAGNGALENQLAWGLVTNPKPELRSPATAVKLAQKAVELAPAAGNFWNTLGVAQYRAGDWKAAETALEKSMELRNGGDSADWFFVAMAHWQLGEKDLAQKWYKAARLWTAKYSPQNDELKRFRAEAAALMGLPETEPIDKTDEMALGELLVEVNPQASSYRLRGESFANSEQWDRAADDFAKAIELGDKNFQAWYEQALVRRAKDDKPGYQAACADMLKQFAQTENAETANFVAWSCALGPDALTDFASAIALAEKAVGIDAASEKFANSLGAILYRAGRFDDARQRLDEAHRLATTTEPRRSTPAYTWFFLAMTHHRSGHIDEAKKWLDKAREETGKALKEHDAGTATLAWNRRLTLTLLRREAEELIGIKQTPTPQTTPEDKPAKEQTKS